MLWVTIYVLCGLCFSFFWIGVLKAPFWNNPAEPGNPHYFENDRLYWGAISDYAICGERLYLLYDEKEVMQCYDLSGNYLCSYSFCFSQNGSAALHTDGSNLFLEDRKANFYVFSPERGFQAYYARENNIEEIESCSERFFSRAAARTAENGERFELKWASIYKTGRDGTTEKVVARPFWMAIFQNGRGIICTIVLGAMIAVRFFLRQRKNAI